MEKANHSGDRCPHCLKTHALCLCADLQALPNHLEVVILQHPQEQDKELGTAPLIVRSLKKVHFKRGLSWAGLKKILNRDVDYKDWGVLYLGQKSERLLTSQPVVCLNKRGHFVEDFNLKKLKGVVLLDGNWSQAKALWWRNAWLLKLHRLVLQPSQVSRYGHLRKEPRRECLSTLESLSFLMKEWGENIAVTQQLDNSFDKLLQKYRQLSRGG